MANSVQHSANSAQEFPQHWEKVTADSDLTRHGFRRFKTTQLINLRFLEDEIVELDRIIYQASLSLGFDPSSSDTLGLRDNLRNTDAPRVKEKITQEMVLKLRDLIKEYNDALIAFNQIMTMETFSLMDDERQSSLRTDLSLHAIYNTRLIRTDLGTRSRTDPFQRRIHKYLRDLRYWRLSKRDKNRTEVSGTPSTAHRWHYQNTVLIAEVVGRVTTAVIIAVFLVVPLVILGYQPKNIQVAVISVFILVFSFVVSSMLKISNLETMAVSAAYAAVLATFVTNDH
ncbi:hypothetical protein F5Y07DRAFT_253008 [Xylaria sp. FL0933]|nr:hypothetical protein F5Y07DRAFT_253008 [Xylaria sp. FL0933]